jgi:hypothetical protein
VRIRRGAVQDADAIARVINEAFRIAESFFIDGDRTNSEEVRAVLDTGVFLLGEMPAAC